VIGNDRSGPVAESVDARAMHRSLSWFKSRPGLQPSLLRSFGWQASQEEGAVAGLPAAAPCNPQAAKMPVDWAFKALSRLRNLF
jgi:hypothetical protein